MGSQLTAERVRRDVEVLARGGLDIATFCAEVDESLGRAVRSCASCVATLDPATNLLTGGFKFGDLAGRDEFDQEWGLGEYGQVEPTSFTELAPADVPAAGVYLATGGDVQRSPRILSAQASSDHASDVSCAPSRDPLYAQRQHGAVNQGVRRRDAGERSRDCALSILTASPVRSARREDCRVARRS